MGQVKMIDASAQASQARLRSLLAAVQALAQKVRSGAVTSQSLFQAQWQDLLQVRVSRCQTPKPLTRCQTPKPQTRSQTRCQTLPGDRGVLVRCSCMLLHAAAS